MVAIGAAESAFIHTDGDHLSIFTPADQQRYAPYQVNGYLSFGWWQIFVGVHHDKLKRRTGSDDPRIWRQYLIEPFQCAEVAREVYDNQGFKAWATYNVGAHTPHLTQAQSAVLNAVAIPDTTPKPKNGIETVGTFQTIFNAGVPVLRLGSTDGQFPGRISKLFGGKYLWLRKSANTLNGESLAVWSEEEGD